MKKIAGKKFKPSRVVVSGYTFSIRYENGRAPFTRVFKSRAKAANWIAKVFRNSGMFVIDDWREE